jgi:hypothetical protein
MKVPPYIYNFFQVEIRNEEFGGDRPATLASAQGSALQAPDDILDEWCDGDASHLLAELDRLIRRYGHEAELIDFDEAAPLEELADAAE